MLMGKRLSDEEFKMKVKKVHGDDMEVIKRYKDRKKVRVRVRHKCGYEWDVCSYSLVRGFGCPVCSGNKKVTTEEFKERVYKLVGDEYTVLGEYINNSTPIEIKHNVCNTTFYMAPKAFSRGQRCPNERYIKSAKSNSHDIEYIKDKIRELGDGEYEIIGEYKNASSNIEFLHKKCGRKFYTAPKRFINNRVRCSCNYISKGEETIETYLKTNNIIYKTQYKIDKCRNIKPLPFDFAIFDDKGSLKCLIEYDGEQHFKPKFSQESFERTIRNDKIKNQYCENNNIPLIRIKYIKTNVLSTLYNYIEKELSNLKDIIDKTIPSQAS